MSEIAAKDVAALRKATGAGMMDCKRALEETSGDMEEAQRWLREQGLVGATKRSGREASDGAVAVVVDGSVGAIVEVNCETDFVAKSEDFAGLVADLAQQVLEHGPADAEALSAAAFGGSTVGDAVKELGAKVGENVALGRVVRFESEGGIVDGYQHMQNDRGVIGVLVEVGGVDAGDQSARSVAHDLALHIASAAPRWATRADVPAEVLDEERAVLEKLTRNEGKPEEAVPKIVEGRLSGFFKENVLVDQGFVRDPKKPVSSLLESVPGSELRGFARVKVGED